MAVGRVVLFIGLVSDLFRRTWWASEPLTALVCGILLSPAAFGLLHPDRWGIAQETLIEQAARLTLAIGLMGVALRLPKNYTLYQCDRFWCFYYQSCSRSGCVAVCRSILS
ncbi:hypothetical protein [Chroococcidiopsis sp. SAG 2025]|uniref:hypothetical protein n=1 Tax=Chroococcidiopsis sp. SAG 2025 TaxID=171389 RepID=UPI002936E91B|nr:hypothetical protein [Chroococcidiopsis sp. SAG 2025]